MSRRLGKTCRLIRRTLKWGGAAFVVLSLILWLGSYVWQVQWRNSYRHRLVLKQGSLRVDVNPSRERDERTAISVMQRRLASVPPGEHPDAPRVVSLKPDRHYHNEWVYDLEDEIDAMTYRLSIRRVPQLYVPRNLRFPNYHTELWVTPPATPPGLGASLCSFNVPVWPLPLLLVVPSVFAWWIDARSVRWRCRRQCQKCGYDRRGLAANALCPECGSSPTMQS